MGLAQNVVRFLQSQKTAFEVIEAAPFNSPIQAAHNAGIDPLLCTQTILLEDRFGLILAVLPAVYVIDYNALKMLFKRHFIRAPEDAIKTQFEAGAPELLPPLGDVFGLRTLIDQSVAQLEEIVFPVGDNTRLVRMKTRDFEAITSRAWHGGQFAIPVEVPANNAQSNKEQPVLDIRKQIESVKELPPLPKTAMRILEISHNPYSSVKDLVEVVELDPSLAAQVIRYANSPFFNYRGSIFSVHDAIARVLGFDNVMNLALGVATAKPFRLPKQGRLGLNQFWRNATYSAALAQALCKILPKDRRLNPGVAYLCGLLHNFGYLVLGHLFSKAYFLLSKLAESESQTGIIDLETRSIGVHHGQLGHWLLQAWDLPVPVLMSVLHHHDESYDGVEAGYVHLVLIADRLINSLGFGEQALSELPETSLKRLGFTEPRVVEILNRVLDGCDGLNTMARQLVA